MCVPFLTPVPNSAPTPTGKGLLHARNSTWHSHDRNPLHDTPRSRLPPFLCMPRSYTSPPRLRRHTRAKHTTELRRPHIPQQTNLIVRSYGRRRPLPATASPGCVSHPSKNKWLRPRHVRFRLAHTHSHSAYRAHMYTHSLLSHHL